MSTTARRARTASGLVCDAMAACRGGDTLLVTKLDRLSHSLPDVREPNWRASFGQVCGAALGLLVRSAEKPRSSPAGRPTSLKRVSSVSGERSCPGTTTDAGEAVGGRAVVSL